MAVPDFQTLMLPMLETLSDGQVRRVIPDVSDVLAARFHLTAEDLEQMLPSGAMPTFINRTHWASTYMSKAELLERPQRGHIQVTRRGLDLLVLRRGGVEGGQSSGVCTTSSCRNDRPMGMATTTAGGSGPTASGWSPAHGFPRPE
jgi:hypothetical protein